MFACGLIVFFFPEIVRRSHVSLRPDHQVQLDYGGGARVGIVPLVEVLDADGRVRLRLLREGALAGGACLGLGGQHEALGRGVMKRRGKKQKENIRDQGAEISFGLVLSSFFYRPM